MQIVWSFESVRAILGLLKPLAIDNGFDIALTGEVLSNGQSPSELNLIAINRYAISTEAHLVNKLITIWGDPSASCLLHFRTHLVWDHLKITLTIVTPLK